MIKRILNIADQDDDPPSGNLEKTIKALQDAIDLINQQLATVSHSAEQQLNTIKTLEADKTRNLNLAKKYFNQNNKSQAQSYWQTARSLETQISKYEKLYGQIKSSETKLKDKKAELEYNREELRSQLEIGKLTADAAQAHAEIMENLFILQNNGELTRHLEMLEEAESKSEAYRVLNAGEIEDEIDQALDKTDPIADIKTQLTADQEKKSKASLDLMKAKYKDFFDSSKNESVQHSVSQPQKLNDFKLDNQKGKEHKISEFFKEEPASRQKQEHKDRIKDFFREE